MIIDNLFLDCNNVIKSRSHPSSTYQYLNLRRISYIYHQLNDKCWWMINCTLRSLYPKIPSGYRSIIRLLLHAIVIVLTYFCITICDVRVSKLVLYPCLSSYLALDLDTSHRSRPKTDHTPSSTLILSNQFYSCVSNIGCNLM